MAEGRGRDMRLKITGCKMLYAGTNPRGDRYTIYEIEAVNPEGQRIEHKLRSFQELPTGRELDVHVTAFDSEAHGRSYTVQLRGGEGKTSTQKQIEDLARDLAELRSHVETVADRVQALEHMSRAPATPDEPPGVGW